MVALVFACPAIVRVGYRYEIVDERNEPHIALPGRGVQLNQFGNLSKAKIKRIAQDLNSSGQAKRFRLLTSSVGGARQGEVMTTRRNSTAVAERGNLLR